MKNPNKYRIYYKLSKKRKPYIICAYKKEKNQYGKINYKTIGYFKTKKLISLRDYNINPMQ